MLDKIDSIAPAWEGLAARGLTPMQQYIWTKASVETFGTGKRLEILTAGTDNEPSAVAALSVPMGGTPIFRFVGAAELGEPMDFACSDGAALEELCRSLAVYSVPVVIDRIVADSPTVAALERAYRLRGAVVRRAAKAFPSIQLDYTWSEPERHLNAGRRSDFRRVKRRAENQGPVSYEHHHTFTRERLSKLLIEAFQVEAAGWKGRSGTAMLSDPVCGKFFERYAFAAADRGLLRLDFLRIGTRAAAVQVGVECGGRFWLLKIGYDERFARCSPGSLLLLESLRDAARRGVHSYELLGRAEPWTRVWTEFERPCVCIEAYPASLNGLSRLLERGAQFALRKLRNERKKEEGSHV